MLNLRGTGEKTVGQAIVLKLSAPRFSDGRSAGTGKEREGRTLFSSRVADPWRISHVPLLSR